MTRTDRNLKESDGPDKLKDTFACLWHHSGVGLRTFDDESIRVSPSAHKVPITDYNCCCNPCLYTKPEMIMLAGTPPGETGGEEEEPAVPGHCCRCNPNVIVATYTPNNSGDECSPRSEVEPLFLYFSADGTNGDYQYAAYQGTLVGRTIKVFLSSFPVDYNGDVDTNPNNEQCQWSMYIGDIGGGGAVYSATGNIDHTGVTCLGLPNIFFSGITVYAGSGGTISLSDYHAYKVPFSRRADDSGIFTIPNISRIEDSQFAFAYQDYSPEATGLSITLPSGRITPPPMVAWSGGKWPSGQTPNTVTYEHSSTCTKVPRLLCVRDWNDGDGLAFKRWREYVFDSGYYPKHIAEFHPDYTGVDYFTTGTALCRWNYTPLGYGNPNQYPPTEIPLSIYLYETYLDEIARFSGNMDLVEASGQPSYILRPHFEADTSINNLGYMSGVAFYYHRAINTDDDFLTGQLETDGEHFYWVPYVSGAFPGQNRSLFVDDCGCNLSSQGNTFDASAGTIDYYVDIRPGRCSCWQYYCSDACRCIPEGMCYAFYYNESGGDPFYSTGGMGWNPSTKCWESSINGSGISICLKENRVGFIRGQAGEAYTGFCQAELGGPFIDDIGTQSENVLQNYVSCNNVDFTFSFGGQNESGTNSFLLEAHPTFGDCFRLYCQDASPCGDECGSHPDSITLSASGYSIYDEDECFPRVDPGIDCSQTCTYEMTLYYYQTITLTPGPPPSIEIDCGYKGIGPCGRIYTWKDNGTQGTLTIDNDIYIFTSGNGDVPQTEYLSYACDPYEVNLNVDFKAPTAFSDWFGCPDECTIHRIDIVIMEN
jgi:hypothetical protein